MTRPAYEHRPDAGKRLAALLRARSWKRPLVLALPRGGVPVGFEVARALNAPLDVLVVRKLGVPGHEELAMGAIGGGGARVLNEEVVRWAKISPSALETVIRRESAELERRQTKYRSGQPPVDVSGRDVILADDGLATGATMRVAVQILRQSPIHSLTVAVPVGASESCEAMKQIADDVVCALVPERFLSVGAWYEHFDQTSDDEVIALLETARASTEDTSTDVTRATEDTRTAQGEL